MNENEYAKDVKFTSILTKSKCNVCDSCKKISSVIKLKLPETKYFDGKIISTKYSEYWLCMECKTKLLFALEHPKEEKTND